MPLTPLEHVEASIHQQFGEKKPSPKEAGDYLVKRFPRMDGGIAIAIALTALALQGWDTYRKEMELRRQRLEASGNPPRKNCRNCGSKNIEKDLDGSWYCNECKEPVTAD